MNNIELIDKLNIEKTLEKDDFIQLIASFTNKEREYAAKTARDISVNVFGKVIYFRGIIEFTNICKNDCLYCGIRRSNDCVSRYRLRKKEILECCKEGHAYGYRTFVLQGGEDGYFNDEIMTDIVSDIHNEFPDCAITLSLGERSKESYKKLFDAGAGRYLLRHETANEELYNKLHPANQSFSERMKCLDNLKEIGYQTGCGMMVGAPYQTIDSLAEDMLYIKKFNPQMVGIGPFLPHKDTPFRDCKAGSANMTLLILSLIRIMLPNVLLPATTALGTLQGNGRQLGVLAGCNVVMPNLSPLSVRKKYMLYDNKIGTHNDAKSSIKLLKEQMNEIGYNVVIGKGDFMERNKND